MKEALGPHVFEKFIELATSEWSEYSRQVSKWELDNYLRKF